MKPLHELSQEELSALRDDEFIEQVIEAIDAYSVALGPNLRLEHLRLARSDANAEMIEALWKEAPPPRPEAKPPEPQPTPQTQAGLSVSGVTQSPTIVLGGFKKRDLRSVGKAEPIVEDLAGVVKRLGKPEFHPSDKTPEPEQPVTIDEQNKALSRLAKLLGENPIEYAKHRTSWAKKLCIPLGALDKAVKLTRDRENEKGEEQSQATKLVAVGLGNGVRLWHNAEGLGYASVAIGDHWENYRLGSTPFDEWLRTEYGHQNQVKIGDRWLPQVPGAQAIRDAVSHLKGFARQQDEREPVIRVGGTIDDIWIDLGDPEWRAIHVTAKGWRVLPHPDVTFVRTGAMRPLPEPVKGGSIQDLRRVLNVMDGDFVLCCGIVLQWMSPLGPYPIVNMFGEPGMGKTSACNAMQRLTDPNSMGVRRVGKAEDVMIAARNNRILAFDNMSWISKEISDLFCMIATGVSTGKRTNYTDDEEFGFSVMRPIIFNGIPSELTERSDLADRAIKFSIPPITKRLGPIELEREFVKVWPKVLGALLDGLVGAIRNWQSISVDDPARMIDFERWAEAGCRAMGFDEWEFVDAYAANRRNSMAEAAEASAVGRAIMRLVMKKDFFGTATELLEKLQPWRGDARWHEWPKDPTRLSGELRRLRKPLAAIGITLKRGEDLRNDGIADSHRGIRISKQR